MKFKSVAVLVFAVSSAISSAAFASGKNVVTCEWNKNDDAVFVRQDSNGQLVVLYSMIDHGTDPYEVEEVPAQHGLLGAGLNYRSNAVELHINTDGPSEKGYFIATLSIPSLGVKNEQFECKLDR